jgi:ABC-type glycerol-3-phosphate transport system permease component
MKSSRTGRSVKKSLLHLVMIVLTVVWILPIVFSLLIGFKTTDEYLRQRFWELPRTAAILTNLASAWFGARLGFNFLNSLLYGLVAAAGSILIASLAAYSLVWFRPRFGFLVFLLIWSGTIFPFQMYLVPLFRTYLSLGLYDTKLGMCLFYIAIAIPFSTFVFRGTFSTIPKEIGEAATIDGCTQMGVLMRFILPLSKSAIAVLVLFTFIWVWNDLTFGLILTKSVAARPVMPALAVLIGAYTGGTNYPILMAGTLIVTAPVLVLFLVLRNEFIRGLTLTTAGE